MVSVIACQALNFNNGEEFSIFFVKFFSKLKKIFIKALILSWLGISSKINCNIIYKNFLYKIISFFYYKINKLFLNIN